METSLEGRKCEVGVVGHYFGGSAWSTCMADHACHHRMLKSRGNHFILTDLKKKTMSRMPRNFRSRPRIETNSLHPSHIYAVLYFQEELPYPTITFFALFKTPPLFRTVSSSTAPIPSTLLPVQISISSNFTHFVPFQNLYPTSKITNTGNRI